MVSTGKAFENKVRNWFKDQDVITFKFPDYASTGLKTRALCDRVVVSSKRVYWFELKHTESTTSFNLGLIRPHQWKSMKKLERLNQYAYFLVENGNHDVFALLPSALKCLGKGKKSVKFRDLVPYLIQKEYFL